MTNNPLEYWVLTIARREIKNSIDIYHLRKKNMTSHMVDVGQIPKVKIHLVDTVITEESDVYGNSGGYKIEVNHVTKYVII